MLNLIEPESLVRHFVAHPPEGFSTRLGDRGAPLFATTFDLLTTADAATRRQLALLPLHERWRRLLRLRTCFVGTTVSEYLLVPPGVAAADFIDGLLQTQAPHYPLLIIKDIPLQSPLLSAAANRYAEELVEASRRRGCAVVAGQALAYVPIDFESIDQYVERLSAARRKDLRRKLRSRQALEIEAVPTGSAQLLDPATLSELYSLYLNVYQQSSVHFDLLTPAFFAAVLADASSGGVAFLYRLAGRLIGYNLCFEHDGKLIDKYVGFRYPQARESNLYFVSWFHNLQYALARGLEFYVAGWTDPQIKRDLGARFTWTRHVVYARSRMLRAVLRNVGRHFESDHAWYREVNHGAAGHS
jgi:hypothetical protein